ncbi:hypothetical protein VNO78_02965 [Psophocarpus tetragonolobus]|uniref:Uncharacterized protein n=1 Tax=Psophocarpus tetragonolobus TaxID=3891 RepID=A0AAN9SZS6_PSOTE
MLSSSFPLSLTLHHHHHHYPLKPSVSRSSFIIVHHPLIHVHHHNQEPASSSHTIQVHKQAQEKVVDAKVKRQPMFAYAYELGLGGEGRGAVLAAINKGMAMIALSVGA